MFIFAANARMFFLLFLQNQFFLLFHFSLKGNFFSIPFIDIPILSVIMALNNNSQKYEEVLIVNNKNY